MAGLRERFHAARAAYKAFWGSGDWVDSERPGNRYSSGLGSMYWVPGTRINWDAVTGDLWTCPAVQACLNWEFRNAPQAPPVVREKQKDGNLEVVPDHPLIALLNRPNPQYDWTVMLQAIILSIDTNGNGYLAAERTVSGRIAELWWLPHHLIRSPSGPDAPWEYWPKGVKIEIPPENMFPVRFGIDPYRPGMGLAPLASAKRGVYTLQQATNYGANIMRNFGTVGAFASPKTIERSFDPKAFVDLYRDKLQGDNVGDVFAIDVPIDVIFPQVTPEKMALETVQDRPEADIAALIGIPPQVAGLHVGRLSKTYANVKEAREAAWEEKIMPMLNMIGCQLGYRLLPEFSPGDTDQARQEAAQAYSLGFDYSQVRPLQPDLDALHDRLRKDWLANLIPLSRWKQGVGDQPQPGDENIYYRDVASAPLPPVIKSLMLGNGNGNGKGHREAMEEEPLIPTDWAARMETEIAALHAASV